MEEIISSGGEKNKGEKPSDFKLPLWVFVGQVKEKQSVIMLLLFASGWIRRGFKILK
ncbi:MAG: hypothetical protein ACPLRX_01915 [Candidatus Saccharicenans sp.]